MKEFKTNDKCAAGAGGFLERAARYLELSLQELGDLSLNAEQPQRLTTGSPSVQASQTLWESPGRPIP